MVNLLHLKRTSQFMQQSTGFVQQNCAKPYGCDGLAANTHNDYIKQTFIKIRKLVIIMTNNKTFTINHRQSMFGNTILEKNQLAEIEAYIQKLELKNEVINKKYEMLENKSNKLIQKLDELNHDHYVQVAEIQEVNETLEFIQEHIPRSSELIDLKNIQEKINIAGGFSETYFMSDSDVGHLFSLGSEVTQAFLESRRSNIPLNNSSDTATLHFVGNSYEGSGSDAINVYTDYALSVTVYDSNNKFKSEQSLGDFMETRKD